MTARSWLLVVEHLGRPPTANADNRLHHHERARLRKQWRDAGCTLARLQHIPPLAAVDVTVQARYRHGPITDPDAVAPAVKGVVDGLVDAGVVADDTGERVHSIRYLAPRVEKGSPDALLVRIDEVAA